MDSSINFLLQNIFSGGTPLWAYLLIWTIVLLVSLFALIRGSDTFVEGARHIGSDLGMSKFAIGVFVVGFGTSIPEFASSLAAALDGQSEIVIANVVGSNVTNILLIVGLMTVIGGRIIVKRDLIKAELPVFFIATTLFFMTVADGVVNHAEALLLLGTFCTYVWYLFYEANSDDHVHLISNHTHTHWRSRSLLFMLIGTVGILVGAHYAVVMVVNIAHALVVPLGLISILAIAVGTSLPELSVSIQAMRKGEQDLALGNIYGSVVFNFLVVVGIPALITPLIVGSVSMDYALGILMATTIIFFLCGLAKEVLRWQGMMMLMLYAYFILELFQFV